MNNIFNPPVCPKQTLKIRLRLILGICPVPCCQKTSPVHNDIFLICNNKVLIDKTKNVGQHMSEIVPEGSESCCNFLLCIFTVPLGHSEDILIRI